MNLEFWKKLKEEYKEDDLEGTDAARKKRARQTPGQETMEDCGCNEGLEDIQEAEYQGKQVKLNKPMRDSGGKKKFKVYVMGPKGNVVIVRFGDPNMEIKRDDPDRRRNFRARHNCDNPGPKWKARYWSCYQWRGGAKVEDDFKPTGNFISESLKDWFGSGGKGGKGGGGWDRYSSTGERLGKCGDGEEGEAYAACLSTAKAKKLGKKGIAKFVRRKRAAQRKAGDPKKGKGESGETKTSKAPTRVETGTREKKMESRESFGKRMIQEAREKQYLEEKNVPTDKALYARVKAEAKRKFDVYPSAYANAWLVKTYKKRGGGYRTTKGD
tara:strand:- start:1643 stop:2623 length:981 start_codon:yes stop_codon:yes gene_type:complete